MKRPIALVLLALLAGFGLGLFYTHSVMNPAPPASRTLSLTSAPTSVPATPLTASPSPADNILDPADDALLLEQARVTLTAIQAKDFTSLSALIHPQDGVTFTPYSTVDLECNQHFTAQEVLQLQGNKTLFTWGVQDGSGDPIQLTAAAYFDRYVYNADYLQAPVVDLDTIHMTGNAMENVEDAYPGSRFVEYHFPGLNPKHAGYDWCSLKLVFRPGQDRWYLVGVIHSEWTV